MSIQRLQIHNLPSQPTPFIGREPEITEIVGLLQDDQCRLLTLLGAGGMGKTRLGIESIQQLTSDDFEHGVFYVPLAPLTSANNIVTTVISVLGIMIGDDGTPQEELIKFLKGRNLLLVMDNFEHLLDGADLVVDILHSVQNVKILVTSRETLNLSMEHIWHVQGMRYPDIKEPDDINQYDALNLFVERAVQIRRDFSPGDEQFSIIQICNLVAGLPLAIELAAGWLKTISCYDIIKQIKQSIDFLSTRNRDIPDRHRSIVAVFDHSWNLLTANEQSVFPRLSIVRGGFTLEAAQEVAGADLITLSSLIEKSMIRRDTNGRYDVHELLRQYGKEKLKEADATEHTLSAHLAYFADFMLERVPDLQGRRQIDSLNEIRADFDNVRIAFQYASEHSMYAKLDEMLECIAIYFDLISYPPFTTEVYAFAIAHLDESPEPEHERLRNRLKVFSRYAYFRQSMGRIADQLIDEIRVYLEIAEQYNDQLATMLCLVILAHGDNFLQFHPNIHRALKLSEKICLFYVGRVLEHINAYYIFVINKNTEVTLDYLNRYREVTHSIGDINGTALAYYYLAHHARFWGKVDDGIYYFDQMIQGVRQTGDSHRIAINEAQRLLMTLQQGEFAFIVQKLPHWIERFTQFGFLANHSYMYMILAKTEAFLANYGRSKTYLQQARSAPLDARPRTQFHIIEVEIICAIGLDDFRSARCFIIQALRIDNSVISTRLMLNFLTLIAFLYHHDQQHTRAIELLGLIFTHPFAATGWMEKWEHLSQLREILQNELGEHAYTMAWERGTQLDVDDMLAEIRAYLGIDTPITTQQALIDPLTERELEVLEFLGDGYSNRDIATHLTVVIGTVKSHVHNICQKLGVKNRTQAVLKAKEIGLL